MGPEEEHLKLLSVFHYVLGGLTGLLSCMFIVHIVMGIVWVSGGFEERNGPPRAFGWVFIVMGSLFILFGWTLAVLILVAGRKLAQRRSWLYCMVVAALECLLMPFGTVLGIFTIILLMQGPDVVEGDLKLPNAVYDYKFGKEGLTTGQIRHVGYVTGFPPTVPIIEVRPYFTGWVGGGVLISGVTAFTEGVVSGSVRSPARWGGAFSD